MTDTVLTSSSAATLLPPPPMPIELTERAISMVTDAMAQEGLEGHGLRIGVIGGGCSGLQYLLDFSPQSIEDDIIADSYEFPVYIDPFSAAHLAGTVVDYVDTLQGAGFKFNNPGAQRTCGCGSSFA